MKLEYQVTKKDSQQTVNQILVNYFNVSTRLLTKLIRLNRVFVNQKNIDTRNLVSTHDIVTIDLGYEEESSNVVPTSMKLDIIYEDEWMLVINKPAGIPIHPSRLHYTDSLSNGVKFYFDSIKLFKKIRPINRLDLNTSGVVIFAKCEYIQECFIKQMYNKTFKKEYLCLIDGLLESKMGTIQLPIARKKDSIIERCIDENNGQLSITHYRVLKEFTNYSLIKCQLETGRTHQIRVHMAAIGHPLLR